MYSSRMHESNIAYRASLRSDTQGGSRERECLIRLRGDINHGVF